MRAFGPQRQRRVDGLFGVERIWRDAATSLAPVAAVLVVGVQSLDLLLREGPCVRAAQVTPLAAQPPPALAPPPLAPVAVVVCVASRQNESD